MTQLSFEVVEGPGAGRVIPLHGSLVIGGGAGSDVRLDDPHLDPAHTRVTESAGGALVEDLGEPGGTFVNHAELRIPTRMAPGDLLQIGVSVLKLREGAGAPSEVVEGPPPPAVVPPRAQHEIDELLDVRVKRMARHAPLAVFVIVVWAVLLYLATARL